MVVTFQVFSHNVAAFFWGQMIIWMIWAQTWCSQTKPSYEGLKKCISTFQTFVCSYYEVLLAVLKGSVVHIVHMLYITLCQML